MRVSSKKPSGERKERQKGDEMRRGGEQGGGWMLNVSVVLHYNFQNVLYVMITVLVITTFWLTFTNNSLRLGFRWTET